tara:strand:+ start:716 stop:1066 length:351 start_codon:yes stop_codon:yes gene_type:complete
MKKVLTFVYRNDLGDCTNNGLTSIVNRVWLVSDFDDLDPKVMDELEVINAEEPILCLIPGVKRGMIMGRWLNDIAVPFDIYKSSKHYMAGGNFIYTSDSRFPGDAPISVHDRLENN